MEERKPIHKLAARWGLAACVFFFLFLLMTRFVYINQKKQITALFLAHQKELAALAAMECDDLFSGVSRALKASQVSGTYPSITSERTMRSLESLYEGAAAYGVLDIIAVGREGEFSSASGYLSSTGMSPEDIYKFLKKIVQPVPGETHITEIVQIDKKHGKSDFVILVSEPLLPQYPMTEEEQSAETPGFVSALLNVDVINRKVQSLAGEKKDSILFMIDRNGYFLSHPRPEFVGTRTNEALNLGKYEKLLRIIGEMREGQTGIDWYSAPDIGTGRKDVRWLISYSPSSMGRLSAAVTSQENSIPILRSLRLKYTLFSLGFLAMILACYLLLLRERHRFLDLESNATRLGDAATVNEMLCTINADLTEEKKKLEQKLLELKSINRERETRLKNLAELHEHLESTIRRPTRGQRNLLNEISREIKQMLRPHDGRGRKRSENPPFLITTPDTTDTAEPATPDIPEEESAQRPSSPDMPSDQN